MQESDEEMDTSQDGEGSHSFVAHVPVPSQEEVYSGLVVVDRHVQCGLGWRSLKSLLSDHKFPSSFPALA